MIRPSNQRLRAAIAWTVLLVTGCPEDSNDSPAGEDGSIDTPRDSGPSIGVVDGAVRDAGAFLDAAPTSTMDAADARPASDADAPIQSDAAARVCSGDQHPANAEKLAALRDCTTIDGNLSVTGDLAALELPNLMVIEGFLTVWSNDKLKSVSFPKLRRIGGYLDVSYNAALQSISMSALQSVNDRGIFSVKDVAIKDNPSLPPCQAEALRDQLKAAGFQGSIDVSMNGGTCAP